MELHVNNNNMNMSNLNRTIHCQFGPRPRSTMIVQHPRRKRDFRFQVIRVCQGPKWFVWPQFKDEDDEDEQSEENKNDQENTEEQSNNDGTSKTCLQLNLDNGHQTFTMPIDSNITSGALTPVTATNQLNDQSPMSEPTTRRIAFKPTTAKSEPISMSAPSTTFKILSISKKWNDSLGESDDEDYLDTQMAEECSQMTLGGSLPTHSGCGCSCRCFGK
ncbi:hypothetical protein QR680_001393 [Steinernema hermaphroditum]|uniref:Uncharacterized protein n=1 Tax=Steinernema hermaphroditum TaxID=289476 RepID=A0AA39LFY3_9BILA|nr:hypothetical protein QR680_001393 [Steinernema hermaphroditum]